LVALTLAIISCLASSILKLNSATPELYPKNNWEMIDILAAADRNTTADCYSYS